MTDPSDQTGKGQQDDEGTVSDPERDTPPPDRPDPTQELWSTDRTEQVPRQEATRQLPTGDESAAAAAAPVEAAAPTVARASAPVAGATPAATWPPPVPPRPTGLHAPAIVLGLVCLAIAAVVLAQELGNLTIDWGDVGPLGFVAVGAVLVVLGAVGLIGSQRRGPRP